MAVVNVKLLNAKPETNTIAHRMALAMKIARMSCHALSAVASAAPKESMTSPMRNMKQGKPAPVRTAKTQPQYILRFSCGVAKLISFPSVTTCSTAVFCPWVATFVSIYLIRISYLSPVFLMFPALEAMSELSLLFIGGSGTASSFGSASASLLSVIYLGSLNYQVCQGLEASIPNYNYLY